MDLHKIPNVAANEIWVFIFVVRQEWHTLRSSFCDLSAHFKLFSFASDTFLWIRLLGITALDSDTGWCHTPGCPLPLSWHLIMFGMASRLFMDVATSVMRQLLPFTWHRSDAVSTRYSFTADISGQGSTVIITWRTSVYQDGSSCAVANTGSQILQVVWFVYRAVEQHILKKKFKLQKA